MKDVNELLASMQGKRVLFITTKNLDYIRNTQEIELLKEAGCTVKILGSNSASYPVRVLSVVLGLIGQRMAGVDVTFVGFSPQLILPFFGRKLKKSRVVVDFFISVYDTLAQDRQVFKPQGFTARFCRWMDKRTLALADEIICDTRTHGQYFIDELGADESRMQVLYLMADRSIYYPRPMKHDSSAPKKVLYFGSILPLQGVGVLLEAIKEFSGRSDICFEIIGPIPDDMADRTLENVKYINWLSQTALAEHIADADLCLAGHFSEKIAKASRTIPGKAYIYEAMDKPFILGDNPANRELFSPDDRHIFVKMGDPAALAAAIREYLG